MKKRPSNTPIINWSHAWLRLECAALLECSAYLLMHDNEKRQKQFPVTDDDMRAFIEARRK